MANETNLHRAARRLQRTEGISYQQARQRILDGRTGRASTGPGRPATRSGFAVGDRLESLAAASIAGAGTVVEVAVDGNENLVRVATDDGSTVTLDVRRFTGAPPARGDAFALIESAHTEEASDLAGLVALSTHVVAIAEPDEGCWVLHCVTDPDTNNVAFVDAEVSADDLEDWFAERGTPVEVLAPDGSVDPVVCVDAGTHLMSCDDDGFCNFCGHDSVDELAAHTQLVDGRCLACRVPGHDTCAMVAGCSCCADTAAHMADTR